MKRTILFYFVITLATIGCSTKRQSAEPLQHLIDRNNATNLTKYLSEAQWDILFPNRYGIKPRKGLTHKYDFYAYNTFVKVSKLFPSFLADGDTTDQKRELAAFLANIAQETSGGWQEAPGGYFKWGLYFLEENDSINYNTYNDTSKKNYPGIAGAYYFGRGPKQLTWNYNYGEFSTAWYGSKDSLLMHPEILSSDPVVSFASAVWFWMTPQFPKPSCHDIMTGKWVPTAKDIDNKRTAGFGATINVINGGVECGHGTNMDKTKYRYEYYKFFCNFFKVSPGDNIDCSNQAPFGT